MVARARTVAFHGVEVINPNHILTKVSDLLWHRLG
jgi:hypothetical protein